MTKENQQQKQPTTKARMAVERLKTLSPKAQIAILLVVKEERLGRSKTYK